NQVQFKDELIKKKFPPNSGFEATYHFNLQQSIPKNLSVVIECPDLYKIFCNDVEVKAEPNEWRFDRAFGKINLSKTAKIGENKIQIVASPMTMEHELEPAYLLGDFSLEPAGKGFVVVSPKPLTLNPGGDADLPQLGWNRQGMPFYADKVEYSRKFNVQKTSAAKRCFVKFDDWYGATAQITVNNKHAGYVVSAPWQIDVTEILEEGENEIAVIVYGTPKNLFGPHHCGQLRGQAWPRHFQSAPEHQPNGTAYDTIGYGLFAPFELIAK
ncbi:MAG: hypothetical protein LBQ54_12500, partial [Planctomycetaceae bacterium]|nr:hypothetical protein [Planctomycetaceae bacterium]